MDRNKAGNVALVLDGLGLIGGVGILIAGLFGPGIWETIFGALCILTFPAALYFWLRYPQVFSLEDDKTLRKRGLDDEQVSIILPLFIPGCFATIHLIRNCSPAHWWQPLIPAAVLMAVLALLILRFLPEDQKKPLTVFFLALVMALSQVGTIWQVNVLLDLQEPQLVQVEVSELHRSRGRKGGSFYSIETTIGGQERTIHVTSEQWGELTVGEFVLVEIHRGGLGMEYYILKETGA